MSANQLTGQELSPKEAWRAKTDEIDDALVRIAAGGGGGAAYIQAAHGSGKSTSFLLHALGVIQEWVVRPRIVYVTETDIEVTFFTDYVGATENLALISQIARDVCDDIQSPLNVCTYYQFIQRFKEGGLPECWIDTVIIFDVQLRPSTHATVFTSIVLEMIRKQSIAGCVLLGVHLSTLTVESFKKECMFFKVIQVPDINRKIEVKCVGLGEDRESSDAAVQSALAQGDMAVVNLENRRKPPSGWSIYDFNYSEIKWADVIDGWDQKLCLFGMDGEVISIDSTSPSVPVPKVSVVQSSGTYTIEKWDTATSQIVNTKATFTKWDLEREKSWLLKAGDSAKEFYLHLSAEEMRKLHTSPDPWCPAWHQDIMWTVMSLLAVHPGKVPQTIPFGQAPQDFFAIAESLKRLVAMRCIEDRMNGRYFVTELGSLALELREMPMFGGLDIHAAVFLARASNKDLPLNVRRVIIRLAAIIAVDLIKFMNIDSGVKLELDEIRQFCAGVGQDQANKGRLWIALGGWLKKMQGDEVDLPDDKKYTFIFFTSHIETTLTMVHTMEEKFGIPPIPKDQEVKSTRLSEAQVGMVEKELVLSYMTRVMSVRTDRNANANTDVVSNCPLICHQDEPLDLKEWKRDPGNSSRGMFFVIYLRLRDIGNLYSPNGTIVRRGVGGLIYIPTENFLVVENVCGKRWPGIVYTSYPLRK